MMKINNKNGQSFHAGDSPAPDKKLAADPWPGELISKQSDDGVRA